MCALMSAVPSLEAFSQCSTVDRFDLSRFRRGCGTLARVKRIVLAVALVVALAAVASATAEAPFGATYQVTVKGQPDPLNGVWLIAFTPKGGYAVTKKPSKDRLIVGNAKVTGNKIVFTDSSGLLACKGGTKGSYVLVAAGKKLTLKILKDPCPGRPLILAGGPFTKVG